MTLSKQEAEFGINMFDSLTPADEPEIEKLMEQGNTHHQATRIIFERRFQSTKHDLPAHPAIAGQPRSSSSINSNRSGAVLQIAQRRTGDYPNGHFQSWSGSYVEGQSKIYNGNKNPGYSRESYLENDNASLSSAGKSSHRSNQSRTSRLNTFQIKDTDIRTLTSMGFSRDQAISALRSNNNNVQMAANSLVLK